MTNFPFVCVGNATRSQLELHTGRADRRDLSIGMGDFTALLVGAGFPTAATLPAVVFGIVEMTMSAGLVKWFRRSR